MARARASLVASPVWVILLGSTVAVAQPLPAEHVPPPDGVWVANATVEPINVISDPDLGAGQGVSLLNGKLYFYGDVHTANPRVGVIREYDPDLRPTGRVLWLRRQGKPLILHPTGLTHDPKWGTFLGDTVAKKARIYRLDWDRVWRDGRLDDAVLDEIDDDAAINGCRPAFVEFAGRPLLATADYGNVHPELRLYDPAALLTAHRSSAPGVVVHRVLVGPFNQNLYWEGATSQLICIQNVIEGRGWRLDRLDLTKAIADGRGHAPGVRLSTSTFLPHNELEGFLPLGKERALFVTSSRRENLLLGTITPIEPRQSPPEPAGSGPAR